MLYKVKVVQEVVQEQFVTVDATNEEEAQELALEAMSALEYESKWELCYVSDYPQALFVTLVEEVEANSVDLTSYTRSK